MKVKNLDSTGFRVGMSIVGLLVLLIFISPALPDGKAGFTKDCESRGGHAEFGRYWTCYDSTGQPERPYR